MRERFGDKIDAGNQPVSVLQQVIHVTGHVDDLECRFSAPEILGQVPAIVTVDHVIVGQQERDAGLVGLKDLFSFPCVGGFEGKKTKALQDTHDKTSHALFVVDHQDRADFRGCFSEIH